LELCCSKEDPIGLWSWEGKMVLCHLLQRLQLYYLPHIPMLNHWLPLLLHLTWLPKTWSHCLVSPIIHTYLLTYLLILNKLKKWERKKEREGCCCLICAFATKHFDYNSLDEV
jgi:hypothetical protein